MEAIREWFLYDGELTPVAQFEELCPVVSPTVYEVFRLTGGKPLFLQEHYARLMLSLASIGGQTDLTYSQLLDEIRVLYEAIPADDMEIKLELNRFEEKRGGHRALFAIAARFPTPEMYEHGVATELFFAERENPQVKIMDTALRSATNQVISERGLYEVMLVDPAGYIREGSRSNLFFIKGSEVYTAHERGVLRGVTRQRIVHILKAKNVPLIETDIPASSIGEFDAAFISGTAPKVLPIARAGDVVFDVNDPILRLIMTWYDRACKDALGDMQEP